MAPAPLKKMRVVLSPTLAIMFNLFIFQIINSVGVCAVFVSVSVLHSLRVDMECGGGGGGGRDKDACKMNVLVCVDWKGKRE